MLLLFYIRNIRKSIIYCLIFLSVALKLAGIKETDGISNNSKARIILGRLILVLIVSTLVVNSIILLSDPHKRHLAALITLDITAAFATGFGILVVSKYKTDNLHGKSVFFLTIGLICWFLAEVSATYSYLYLGIAETQLVSLSDVFWLMGYGAFAVHLFLVISFMHSTVKMHLKSIIAISIISCLFVAYTILSTPLSDQIIEQLRHHDNNPILVFAVNISYPLLDPILIVPSALILLYLRKDLIHSVPWWLSSLSLLLNAIADNGFIADVVKGNIESLWFWDLFFVTDFLIMAAALFWYFKYHNTDYLKKTTPTTQL